MTGHIVADPRTAKDNCLLRKVALSVYTFSPQDLPRQRPLRAVIIVVGKLKQRKR